MSRIVRPYGGLIGKGLVGDTFGGGTASAALIVCYKSVAFVVSDQVLRILLGFGEAVTFILYDGDIGRCR